MPHATLKNAKIVYEMILKQFKKQGISTENDRLAINMYQCNDETGHYYIPIVFYYVDKISDDEIILEALDLAPEIIDFMTQNNIEFRVTQRSIKAFVKSAKD